MKRIFYSLLAFMMAHGVANALELKLTSGTLYQQAGAIENTTDQLLVLSGSADVTDLVLLKRVSKTVETIDMSGLTINAYSYPDMTVTGQKDYSEGELPAYMLAGTNIRNIMFPQNVTSIGEGAFSSSRLRTVSVPQSVKRIGDYAFASCKELLDATLIADSQLGIGLFKDCNVLKSVKFEYPVTYIPARMFDGCVKYTEQVPSTVKSIGDYAFRKTALNSLNLAPITSVGEYAFADMPELKSVTYSEAGSISLGTGTFFNDRGLESLPAFMSELPKLALAQNLGRSLTVIHSATIGEAAYANNPNLDTLTLGAEVRTISKNAFRNLKGLKLVDVSRLKSTVPEVDEEAFSGLLDDTGRYNIGLNVVKGTEDAWNAHPVWSLFKIGQYETGVDAPLVSEEADIKLNRERSMLDVSSLYEIDYLGVYSLDGTLLYESTPGESSVTVRNLPESDILVVKVKSGVQAKVVKLR